MPPAVATPGATASDGVPGPLPGDPGGHAPRSSHRGAAVRDTAMPFRVDYYIRVIRPRSGWTSPHMRCPMIRRPFFPMEAEGRCTPVRGPYRSNLSILCMAEVRVLQSFSLRAGAVVVALVAALLAAYPIQHPHAAIPGPRPPSARVLNAASANTDGRGTERNPVTPGRVLVRPSAGTTSPVSHSTASVPGTSHVRAVPSTSHPRSLRRPAGRQHRCLHSWRDRYLRSPRAAHHRHESGPHQRVSHHHQGSPHSHQTAA